MKKFRRKLTLPILSLGLIFAFLLCAGAPGVMGKEPTGEEFRVGVIGTFSGSAAAWGLTMKYSTEAVAEMHNREGGFLIGGVRHPIKVFAEDDKFDPKLARAAAEKLIYRDNVKYITGPVTSPTCSGAQVVTEPGKAVMVAYGYNKALYMAGHPYTIFGMVAPYQSAPLLYKYLIDKYQVKTISMVAKNYSTGLLTRDWCKEAADKLGLKVISYKETYEPETADFFPVMGSVIKGNPDVIDLTAAGAGDAAQATKAARQLGFKGIIVQETAGDLKVFREIAGKYADGLICLGGATHPAIRTKHMDDYIEIYKKIAGEWNEEAATKLYALEMILETIRTAGPAALKDTEAFRAAMPKVAYKNPYIKDNPIMQYVGKETFGQDNQIGVPVVYVEVQGEELKVILVATVPR